MTYGPELSGGLMEGMGVLDRGEQRGKSWDNCNSIINKISFNVIMDEWMGGWPRKKETNKQKTVNASKRNEWTYGYPKFGTEKPHEFY